MSMIRPTFAPPRTAYRDLDTFPLFFVYAGALPLSTYLPDEKTDSPVPLTPY